MLDHEVTQKRLRDTLAALDGAPQAARDHPVIGRLIREVRNERDIDVGRYDRIHNRHNRGR